MANGGTNITSVSMNIDLWNKIQEAINEDGMDGFSRWVQVSSKYYLKIRKARNIRDFLACLDDEELTLLKKELKF